MRRALERTIRGAIREGALRPGVRLLSSRELAVQVGVSRGVASDVYAQLAEQGFIVMRPRAAPLVATLSAPAPHQSPSAKEPAGALRLDLTPTTPDVTLFPLSRWLAALKHAASHAPTRALDYGEPSGDHGLREALADHLGRTRGVLTDPAHIVVVQGFAQGLDLMLRVLARHGKRRVAVEDPSLEGQLRRVEAWGFEVVACAVDMGGIVVDDVRADAAIVTPAHQFPTGVVMDGERRRSLLRWASKRNRVVIEDDYDAEFRYDRDPVRALQGLNPDRVAYVGTVSKTLAPALRLGWLVAPADLAEEVADTKRLIDFGSPVLDQLALRRFLEVGDYDRHVRRTRGIYRARRDRLIAALAAHLPETTISGVAAGLHVLMQLPPGVDDEHVALEAAREGIHVEPLSRFNFDGRDAPGLVIGYGRIHEGAIEPAVSTLASVMSRTKGLR